MSILTFGTFSSLTITPEYEKDVKLHQIQQEYKIQKHQMTTDSYSEMVHMIV